MIIQDRDASRRLFFDVWARYNRGVVLEALEQLVLAVILEHPEYHGMLGEAANINREYGPAAENNPFLHMGMHIALREQLSTDRPPGVSARYRILSAKYRDHHVLQHDMMGCLAEALWQAQARGQQPDEAAYLECLGKLG